MNSHKGLPLRLFQNETDQPMDDLTVAVAEYDSFSILLVDDEPSVLNSLQRGFLDEPCQVLTAADGRQALALLERAPVHLIISDQRMPGMQGAELLQEVKKRWPDIIRIMLTGYADSDDIMRVVEEVGVFKFITKPWNDDDLRLTARLAFRQYQLQLENARLREINRHQWAKICEVSPLLHDNHQAQANVLLKSGVLQDEELRRAEAEQSETETLLDVLLRLKILSEEQIAAAFCQMLLLSPAKLEQAPPRVEIRQLLPYEFCQAGQLLPVEMEQRHLYLAMVDPSNLLLRDYIEMLTGLQVVPLVATRSAVERCLATVTQSPPEQSSPRNKSLPPTADNRAYLSQMQVGLAAIRQGVECVENALDVLSQKHASCPLCGQQLTAEKKEE